MVLFDLLVYGLISLVFILFVLTPALIYCSVVEYFGERK